jgi:hypothetical protein
MYAKANADAMAHSINSGSTWRNQAMRSFDITPCTRTGSLRRRCFIQISRSLSSAARKSGNPLKPRDRTSRGRAKIKNTK